MTKRTFCASCNGSTWGNAVVVNGLDERVLTLCPACAGRIIEGYQRLYGPVSLEAFRANMKPQQGDGDV